MAPTPVAERPSQRSGRPVGRRPRAHAVDAAVGLALGLIEAAVGAVAYVAIRFGQQRSFQLTPPEARLVHTQTGQWLLGLGIVAVVVAGLAAWRRAPWLAVLQLLAALVFLLLYAGGQAPAPPVTPAYSGGGCVTGSVCPGG
jgi:Family of unknown function (DUF6234)